jgi:lysophospholipase L1-like esterase
VGWSHIPGARAHWTEEGDGWVTINSLGMRDVDRTVARVPGSFRIAVFGDSMTEAVQVNLEQTFTQLLERRLHEKGLAVEVLNFGLSGYSPLSSYLLYKNVGKAFQPDLVIHAVFLDNDIADGDPALAAGQIGAPFVRAGNGLPLEVDYAKAEASYRDYRSEPIYTIRRWSATYRAASIARTRWSEKRRATSSLEQGAGVPKRFMLYATPLEEPWEAAWRTYARILDAFSAEVREAGSRFVLMSVPAGQVVNDGAWKTLLSAFPAMQTKQWSLEDPEQRFVRLASDRQIPLIRPLSHFRNHAGSEPLFFGGTGHLTPLGHQLMAEAMANTLLNDRLVSAGRLDR